MEIVNRSLKQRQLVKGQMSDGSDWQTVMETVCMVKAKDGYKTYQLTFDHDPAEQEIQAKIAAKDYVDITSQEDIINNLQQQINDMAIAIAALLGGAV